MKISSSCPPLGWGVILNLGSVKNKPYLTCYGVRVNKVFTQKLFPQFRNSYVEMGYKQGKSRYFERPIINKASMFLYPKRFL